MVAILVIFKNFKLDTRLRFLLLLFLLLVEFCKDGANIVKIGSKKSNSFNFLLNHDMNGM